MAMTGGTAKLVHTGYCDSNSNLPIKVYVYYKTSTNSSTLKSTVTCGMYVTTPSGWDIGEWGDYNGSYVGTKSLTFDGSIPNFSGTRWLVENKSFTVNHNATTGKATATIYWKWGVNSSWGQCINPSGSFTITLPTIQTKCTAPTSFTVSSDRKDDNGYNEAFETKLTLKWSGAKAGVGNAITGYQILYATNSDNATWNYSNLQQITSTSTSDSVTIDMSSKVSRGNYVRFRIQVLGSAGKSYYSDVKTANYVKANGDTGYAVKRQPYTKCEPPTTFTITSDVTDKPFNTKVTFAWSGAKAGSNNSIESYYIQYATSSNNSTWGDWTKLITIDSTSTSGNTTIDMSSKVTRGHYVRFRIRTLGKAGSDYYSNYKTSSPSYLRRQPYTKCEAPTSFTASPNPFETTVKLSWSGAKAGTANSISSYYIQYATTQDNVTWDDWVGLTTVTSTSTSGSYSVDMSSKVLRGKNVRFRIRTQGSAGSSYYSDYKTYSYITRNPYTKCTAPTTVTITSDVSGKPFENNITIAWSGAKSGTNNAITSYLIRYATSSDNSSWSSYADLATVTSTSTSGSKTINVSSKVTRKHYIKIAIKTIGKVSGYDSGYTYSTTLQRNPYSACGKPTTVTVKSEKDINNVQHTDVFNNQITISWSGASAGENNAIRRYYIEYCTSTNKSTWSAWSSLQSSNLTPVGTSTTTVDISAKVNRGDYTKFRIRTEGEAGSTYYSPYVETSPLRRNSVPTMSSISISEPAVLEYSYGNSIILKWNKATDANNNLNIYEISVRYTQNNNWLSWQVLNASLSNATTTYTFSQSNNVYQAIANNQKVQFRIRVKDVFGEYSTSYSTSATVTRYDDTGVCIGINNKWIPCQFYVGVNGQWVEQTVSAGVTNKWSQCGVE